VRVRVRVCVTTSALHLTAAFRALTDTSEMQNDMLTIGGRPQIFTLSPTGRGASDDYSPRFRLLFDTEIPTQIRTVGRRQERVQRRSRLSEASALRPPRNTPDRESRVITQI
jgi:hypothetical protein